MLMRSSEFQSVVSNSNILLRRLSRFDHDLVGAHADDMVLPRGHILTQPADEISAIYFPISGILSIEEQTVSRNRIEVAVVGCEGLIGWPALLGSRQSSHQVVVRNGPVRALRIGYEKILEACQASPTLWMMLLGFVQTVIIQMGRTIASHLDHSLDQNIARWLLMRHDRIVGNEMLIRHDEIADALSVRRASITDNLHVLEGNGLIRGQRGRLIIRDRVGLERRAGEAYGRPEAQYRSLIAPFGKSAEALIADSDAAKEAPDHPLFFQDGKVALAGHRPLRDCFFKSDSGRE